MPLAAKSTILVPRVSKGVAVDCRCSTHSVDTVQPNGGTMAVPASSLLVAELALLVVARHVLSHNLASAVHLLHIHTSLTLLVQLGIDPLVGDGQPIFQLDRRRPAQTVLDQSVV